MSEKFFIKAIKLGRNNIVQEFLAFQQPLKDDRYHAEISQVDLESTVNIEKDGKRFSDCSPLQVAIQFHKFEIALLIAQKMIKHNTPRINQHIAHAYNLVNDPAFKKCSELKEYHDLKNTLNNYITKHTCKNCQHIEAVT